MAEESSQSGKLPARPASKRQKVPLEVQEQKLSPKPSFWPIVLALALVVTFIGVMVQPIIFFVGVVLSIGVIVGWVLEKQ